MIPVMSAADAAKKWAEVAPQRQSYYEAGVKGAGPDWEKNTTAAAQVFKSAVSAGNIDKMFAGGVKRAGAEKYQRKATDVGVSRYGPGISAAVNDYSSGVTPFLDTISKITLPARQPRGSAANYQRSVVIGTALNKQRLAIRSAGA